MAGAREDTVDLVDTTGQAVTLPRRLALATSELVARAPAEARTIDLPGTRFPPGELSIFQRWILEALQLEGPERLHEELPERVGVLLAALLDLEAKEAVTHLVRALGLTVERH